MCIPQGALRELLVRKAHRAALAGHFGQNKTIDILKELFCFPEMGSDVHKVVSACSINHKTKSQFHQGLYSSLPVPIQLWDNVSMDFIATLPRTQRGKDAITPVVERFSKMAHFVSCHKTDDASYIAKLYFKKIIRLHEVLKPSSCILIQNSYLTFGGVYESCLELGSCSALSSTN